MITEDHNMWKSDKDEFQQSTVPWLIDHGMKVGTEAHNGDEDAKAIINYYKMLYRSYDPVIHILLKEAIESYREAHK